MTFYIKYGRENDQSILQADNSNEIFSLQINQKYGSCAIAKLELSTRFVKKILQENCNKIYVFEKNKAKEECLFAGKILTSSVEFEGQTAQFKVVARSREQIDHLECILNKFRQSKLYNRHLDNNKYSQIIDNQPCNFYYNKSNNNVKLSKIIDDKFVKLTSNDYFRNDVQKRVIEEAPNKLNVNITIDFLKIKTGYQDLVPAIAAKFSGGIIHSYTNIAKYWHQFERKLNKNIYKIQDSWLQPLSMYKTSEPFVAENKKEIAFRHFWFDGHLGISWEYLQKRKEIVQFSIVEEVRDSYVEKNLDISLKLDNLNTNFIYTEDGRNVVQALASRAWSTFLAANRNIEITLTGPYEKLKNITVDNSIALETSDENFYGKVIQTDIVIMPNYRICKIKILGNTMGYLKFNYDNFMRYFLQVLEKYLAVEPLEIPDDIIDKLEIKNSPEYQANSLRRNSHKDTKQIIQRLSKMPTFIKIDLKKLSNNNVECFKLNLGTFTAGGEVCR